MDRLALALAYAQKRVRGNEGLDKGNTMRSRGRV